MPSRFVVALALSCVAVLHRPVGAESCGETNAPFNPTTQMCCAGMVFGRNTSFIICCQDRIFGLGDPSAKRFWDCCTDQAYDTRYQRCEGGRPVAKPVTQTTTTTSLPTTEAFVDYFETDSFDYWTTPTTTMPPRRRPIPVITTTTTTTTTEAPTTPRRRLPPVTTRTTTTTTQAATRGFLDIEQPDTTRSCSERSYNPETQVCCGGYVYVRSTPTTLCCAGALFAIGEADGDRFWECCDKTIFDKRRQTCSEQGVVQQMILPPPTNRPAPQFTMPPPVQQPPTQGTVPPIPVSIITVSPPVFRNMGPVVLPEIDKPQTLPPPTFAPPNAAAPNGFRVVTCLNGEVLTVRDTGAPMACCGRSLYDSSQQVCLGDQYTIHKSLVPGLPSFFVNVLNTSTPAMPLFPPSTATSSTTTTTTSTTTTTTTTTPPTTTTTRPAPTTTPMYPDANNANKMEISCNGNVYQVPFARLDKVACCGQYLYDSRYYQCFNGAVVAINSPTVKLPAVQGTQEYVTSMPFVHSYFPTPGLPMPVQPRSFDRSSDHVTSFAGVKPVTVAPPGDAPFVLPYETNSNIAEASKQPNLLAKMPKPQPSYPVVAPEDSNSMNSMPYVPFWSQEEVLQKAPLNFSMPVVSPVHTKKVALPTPVKPAETYGSQLSMWNRFSPGGDYEPGMFGMEDVQGAESTLPPPVVGQMQTTPKFQASQAFPLQSGSNLVAGELYPTDWMATYLSQQQQQQQQEQETQQQQQQQQQSFGAPATLPPQASRQNFPGFMPPQQTPPRKPQAVEGVAELPKPIGKIEDVRSEPPIKFPFAPNNWPNPASFSNRPIPRDEPMFAPPSINNFPKFPSGPKDEMVYSDKIAPAWREMLGQQEFASEMSIFQKMKPENAVMMTPVTPVESKPLGAAGVKRNLIDHSSLHLMPKNLSSFGGFSNSLNEANMAALIANIAGGKKGKTKPPPNNEGIAQPLAPGAGGPQRKPAKALVTDAKCQNGRLMQAPSKDQDFIYCCSNSPYDIRSQFCCGGTVEEWLGSDNGRVYQLCCDGVYIYNVNGDPNVQCCGRTAINTKYEPCSSASL